MGNFAYAKALVLEYLELHAGEWKKQNRRELGEAIVSWVRETHMAAGIDPDKLERLLELLAKWIPIILAIFGK